MEIRSGLYSCLYSQEMEVSLDGRQLIQEFLNIIQGHQFSSGKLTDLASINFSIELIDDQKMKEINTQYRQKTTTTDVLSFPVHSQLKDAKSFDLEHLELGDIFLCWPQLMRQADESGPKSEFCRLMIHGFLHLWDYDHEKTEEEAKVMAAWEVKLWQQLEEKVLHDS